MANQEQLNILKQGADVWNAWKIHNSKTPVDFNNANLSHTNLRKINLSKADLSSANLSHANLSWADFSDANLSNADLSNANLNLAHLHFTNLISADLSKANLYDTNFSNVNLSNANLSFAIIAWTVFGDVDLRFVKGLDTIQYQGPSYISTSTLERSKGDIPEVFLRSCGLSDTFIVYARSLTQQPIEYYTCFISYSNKDQDFAERIYSDLQNKGVRCWYAPEDIKIGEQFRQRIDESIRLYDKLLLVLSEHSVNSPWVEKEVETAFEKEHQDNTLTLFPIKLDEIVMQTNTAWAADIRRMRHIGDFTRWKDHDAYQQSLQRLIRDLKAVSPKLSL
jgi:TIR domain/Pentapeptide repeats (8 copies)